MVIARSVAVTWLMIGAAASGLAQGARAQQPAGPDPNQVVGRPFPLPLEPEVAARPPVHCNQEIDFHPRTVWDADLWPSGNVYYEFDANVTQPNRDAMRLAMNELETVAHIAYIPRTSQSNYIHIQDSTGNNSAVGMSGGGQTINIFNWNFQYIMEHELMHALGCWHEQSRADRGNYVTVNLANVQSGYAHNFNIHNEATTHGQFDFESIMLYDACAFSTCCSAGSSCNCATSCAPMQALPAFAQFQNVMGNRSYLSAGDKAGLANRYGAPVDDAFEPNNTHATARPIGSGTFNLRLVDNDDYFSVVMSAASTITITETHSEPDADVFLGLYTSAGALLQSANTSTGTATINRPVAAGTYVIRVQRVARWGASYSLSVTGCTGPTVTTNPAPTSACLGGSFQFTGAATDAGTGPFTFFWTRDGASVIAGGRITITPAPNGRSSTLSVTGVTSGDAGQYAFTVGNGCSSVNSTGAAMTITAPPQPSISAAVVRPCRWGAQTYTAMPGGPGSFTYRWQIATDLNATNWTDLTDGPITLGGVPGAAAAFGSASGALQLSNINQQGQNLASFRVIATGTCSPAASTPLSLSVCGADFDCNGILAVADIFGFLNAFFASDPRTDYNGIAGLQVSDVFGFLSTWFNGCP